MTKFTINTRTEAWKADVNLLIQRLFRISRHPLKQEQKGNCPLMKNLSLKLSICTKKLLFCRVYALTYKFTRAEDWTRVLKTFIRQLTFLVKCWVTFDVGVFLTRKGIRPTGNHLFRSSTAFLTKAAPTLRRRNLKTDVSLWKHIKCFPSTVPQRNLKTEVSLWKHIKCFPSTLRWRNLKTQQSPVILDLCLRRKTRAGKSRDYRDVIDFKNCLLHIKTQNRRLQMSLVWRLRFRDGLVWTIGLTVEIKLRSELYPL